METSANYDNEIYGKKIQESALDLTMESDGEKPGNSFTVPAKTEKVMENFRLITLFRGLAEKSGLRTVVLVLEEVEKIKKFSRISSRFSSF